ncbi:hypothetical protein [Seohaeicola zhoushanensis]|uniref:Uncharacterized protein n=1 Tax=Seohaeicola zhoushanensis TaxID=1569283 RepID=A0A8J3H1R5_9RHOB|nr:hypothetical protein [Seohaeicola zhoushanensis]GHF64425.1 hypothetical protein GCM10017056_39640 [Seohaeicola zhoushanensis]
MPPTTKAKKQDEQPSDVTQVKSSERMVLDYPAPTEMKTFVMPPLEDLKHMFGTETSEAACALFATGLMSLGLEPGPERALMGAISAEEKPTSALESMLLQQLVMTHFASARISLHLNADNKSELNIALGKLLNGTNTTFTKQLEAWRRLKSGPTQTMRIEHVTVNEGGQAIVANMADSGGRRAK